MYQTFNTTYFVLHECFFFSPLKSQGLCRFSTCDCNFDWNWTTATLLPRIYQSRVCTVEVCIITTHTTTFVYDIESLRTRSAFSAFRALSSGLFFRQEREQSWKLKRKRKKNNKRTKVTEKKKKRKIREKKHTTHPAPASPAEHEPTGGNHWMIYRCHFIT